MNLLGAHLADLLSTDRRERDDLGSAPIGFGDEIPAFMLIDTKI